MVGSEDVVGGQHHVLGGGHPVSTLQHWDYTVVRSLTESVGANIRHSRHRRDSSSSSIVVVALVVVALVIVVVLEVGVVVTAGFRV
jgi:hypothetical protein